MFRPLLLRLPMLFELYKFAEVGESEFLDFFSPCCYFIEISYKLVKSGELLIKYIDLLEENIIFVLPFAPTKQAVK